MGNKGHLNSARQRCNYKKYEHRSPKYGGNPYGEPRRKNDVLAKAKLERERRLELESSAKDKAGFIAKAMAWIAA